MYIDLIINYLNNISPIKGFIYKNYSPEGTKELLQPRMFLSNENSSKIDAIRTTIENWKNQLLIDDDKYYVLLAYLIESVSFYTNVAGVYAAFHKKWNPRAIKQIKMRNIELVIGDKENLVFCDDSTNLLKEIKADIFYLDPPYNQR